MIVSTAISTAVVAAVSTAIDAPAAELAAADPTAADPPEPRLVLQLRPPDAPLSVGDTRVVSAGVGVACPRGVPVRMTV